MIPNLKVFVSLLSAYLAFLGIGVSITNAQENYTLQQVTNYVMNGHPEVRINEHFDVVAHVFDRENCVSGAEIDGDGFIKIYWNNIEQTSIQVSSRYSDVMGDYWYTLEFSGIKPVVETEFNNLVYSLSWFGWGNSWGLESSATFPIGPTSMISKDHFEGAIRSLYSEHCTGLQEKNKMDTIDETLGNTQSSVRSIASDIFGGLSEMMRESDIEGQIHSLNLSVEKVLRLIEEDQLTRAKFKAMSIKWVPTGEESLDRDQSAHFEEIRAELLKLIEETE